MTGQPRLAALAARRETGPSSASGTKCAVSPCASGPPADAESADVAAGRRGRYSMASPCTVIAHSTNAFATIAITDHTG